MTPTRLTFASANGGVGRTTLVAHLAREFSDMGRVPMAFDLDPQNALGLHLGMTPDETLGITHAEVNRAAIAQMMRRHRASIPYLPFGGGSEQEIRTLEYQIAREPSWLMGRIESLMPKPCHDVLVDIPSTMSPWWRAGLKAADMVVVVVRPEAASFASLPRQEALLRDVLGEDWRARSRYVVNRFDPTRALDRDIVGTFSHVLGERLIEVLVPECISFGEALARGELIDTHETSPARVALPALASALHRAAEAAGRRGRSDRDTVERPVPKMRRLAAVSGFDGEGWQPEEGKGRYHVGH